MSRRHPAHPSRQRRSPTLAILTVAAAVALAGLAGTAAAAPCWNLPVVGRVVDPFRAPACPWCPGNRGIEYEIAGRTVVTAVAAGTVEFSGVVAGERYVVVRLPSGWLLTYGRLTSASVAPGQAVLAGTALGVAHTEFLFGLRVDGDYADPGPYLGVPTGRRRLVPLDGRPPRPAPAAALRCGAGSASR